MSQSSNAAPVGVAELPLDDVRVAVEYHVLPFRHSAIATDAFYRNLIATGVDPGGVRADLRIRDHLLVRGDGDLGVGNGI